MMMSITELFALWRRFNELALLYYQSIDDFGLSASSSFDRLLPVLWYIFQVPTNVSRGTFIFLDIVRIYIFFFYSWTFCDTYDPSSPLRNAYHFHLGCLFSEIAKMRRLSKAQALSSHTNGRSFRMPEKVVFRYSGKVSERQWWPWWWGGGGGIWGQAEVLEVEMPKRPSCAFEKKNIWYIYNIW